MTFIADEDDIVDVEVIVVAADITMVKDAATAVMVMDKTTAATTVQNRMSTEYI